MTIPELYQLYIHHPQVTTDSRNCPKGSLFFALRGDKFDGNEYAQQALSIGAAYAVVDNPQYCTGERTVLVEDSLKALQQLAHYHRKVLNIPVIGVTGTNGKTTTKELMAAVLSSKFNLLYTEGNLNNQIGVPLTLLRLNHEHEMAVIEMGASHPGDIAELAAIALPNYGIITNVGRAHLEGFGSLEGVVKTKGELYDFLRKVKGVAFVKKEDQVLQAMARGLEQVSYGEDETAFASGQVVENNPFLVFNWKQQGKIHTVETHLIGDYNLSNLLAAVVIGRYFKIPAERISRAIAAYEPTNKRSQLIQTGNNTLIVDAYNANPSSMKAALDNFNALTVSPKALILGDMYELGETEAEEHAGVVRLIDHGKYDRVFLCGKRFAETGQAYPVFPTTTDLLDHLKQNPLKGYHILIKGSRSMALEQVVDLL